MSKENETLVLCGETKNARRIHAATLLALDPQDIKQKNARDTGVIVLTGIAGGCSEL